MKHPYRVIGIIAIGAGVIVLALVGTWFALQSRGVAINSFADCVAAGNPVMESFPTKCSAGGKTFENPQERAQMSAREKAIERARSYDPGEQACTLAAVEAVHTETGATYTFTNGCLAPGWEPRR